MGHERDLRMLENLTAMLKMTGLLLFRFGLFFTLWKGDCHVNI